MKKLLLFIVIISQVIAYGNNDKYRLIINDDPATTITIGFNQISGTLPTVHYGLIDFGTDYTMYPYSRTEDRSIIYRGMDNRFVRLTGLIPNTNYYFVIHDSEGTSERFWFKTASNDLSRLSFIAGGDSRNNRAPRIDANTLVSKLKPHAVLFGGDMTRDDTNSQWQLWMDDWQYTTADNGRMFPVIAARGNHEDSSNVIYNLFDTPSQDSYYAITFGDNLIRAYTLNTEVSVSGDQLTWLQNDLEANPNTRWKMAQYHKPMRPHTSGKSEGNTEYNAWAQLFYDKGVRLVVDCDSHTVKTTWPVEPSSAAGNDEGFIRNDLDGTVYAGEGCWGAPLRVNNDDKSWTRNSGSFNQFKLIFIDSNEIELRTIVVTPNASEVDEVSDSNPFTLPDNLDIWNPSEGDVVKIIHTSILGVEDVTTLAEVIISSNPFNDTLEIMIHSFSKEYLTIEIFDIKGANLYKEVFLNKNQRKVIRPNIESNGIYFLRLTSNKKKQRLVTKKIIKL
ncbi:metallophosphoesterase [Flavivirga aquimarina]|uniref:Metallophosphoesterase n=1 Tax=Flavivirga aquimarina TaxID=2027862 RepID=A0ABT8W580_9FLAO|nr:fibronectin type III domain-containing protein [Flavivirga aquimarina]MDO5968273.1 metallophosphoesterase [Flavivirga aquimarina]